MVSKPQKSALLGRSARRRTEIEIEDWGYPRLARNGSHSSTIVERIILGPSLSSPLARNAILKMLDTLGK
jgi:hypothetical protein